MLSLSSWSHERTVEPAGDGCVVRDRLTFARRRPLGCFRAWSGSPGASFRSSSPTATAASRGVRPPVIDRLDVVMSTRRKCRLATTTG